MLCDAVLDTFILFQTNDCVVECLDDCGCCQINFVKNGLMLEAFFILFFNINVKVQLLHFSLAFPICSSWFLLRYWILGLLLICASFDIFLVVPVAQNGNTKGSFLLCSIVNEIYEYYEARSAISLFQMNEFFSRHFWGFKIKIFDPRNVRKPIRSLCISNDYVLIFLTSTWMTADRIWSYVRTYLFTKDKLQLDEASYSNKYSEYLWRHKRLPLWPLTTPTREDGLFSDLWRAVTKPRAR